MFGIELAFNPFMKILIVNFIFILFFSPQTFADNNNNSRTNSYNVYEVSTKIGEVLYKAMLYAPLRKAKYILVLSPTIAGIKPNELANAQFFGNHGYAVIIPYPYYTELANPTPNVQKLDIDYFLPVTVSVTFVELIEQKLQLPNDIPVFALGASQGGITTIIIASHYSRIKAAWISVGGGDMPYIYAYSNSEAITKFRINHMKYLGLTDQKIYENFLRANLIQDPGKSCKNINVPIHQTIASRDDVVPTKTQELLVKECPPHEVIRKNLNHSAGIMTNVLMQEEIKEFFENSI
ncbi:MAG: hypothetical protein K2Q18_12790 [Bdellovibrionales bacterium]|nr:hypothetical protein [Bdellovibrionales bacterium]